MKPTQLFYAAAVTAPVLALYAFMYMTDETADATLKIDLNSPHASQQIDEACNTRLMRLNPLGRTACGR